jgi:hypothetical protein
VWRQTVWRETVQSPPYFQCSALPVFSMFPLLWVVLMVAAIPVPWVIP